MRILVVRHAAAVQGGRAGAPDEERRLTKAGAHAFDGVARRLCPLVPRRILVLTSPLLRARQTAEIASAMWRSRPIEAPALAGTAPGPVLKLLARHQGEKSLALFGHEPGLSRLLALLLGGRSSAAFSLKKGAAALVEIDGPVRAGAGRLLWFLAPRQLRRLGGTR